ncbi:hypothetical protein Tco_0092292 [Tanacetum coccineum]
MVLSDNQGSSPKSMLDDKAFEDSSNDSYFDVDLYLNDEEDNGDNVVIPQTPIIIMAQPQRQADVHQDELCPPNKRYALIDANNKIDLDNPMCPNESKIMANINQNHPLRFSIAASSSVPWIYLGQSPSNFKTAGLVQPWQTLGKIFARCLTTRVTGHDQPPLEKQGWHWNEDSELDINGRDEVYEALSDKSHDELKAKQNVQKVEEHLIAEEIEKLVDGTENGANVEVDSSTLRQDDNQIDLDTRLDPMSDKESPEVESTAEV